MEQTEGGVTIQSPLPAARGCSRCTFCWERLLLGLAFLVPDAALRGAVFFPVWLRQGPSCKLGPPATGGWLRHPQEAHEVLPELQGSLGTLNALLGRKTPNLSPLTPPRA